MLGLKVVVPPLPTSLPAFRLPTINNIVAPLPPPSHRAFDQPFLLRAGPILRQSLADPPRPSPEPELGLPLQGVPQRPERNGGLGRARSGLVADGTQGRDPGGVDGLDGAHEVELGVEVGEHGGFFAGGGRGREGRKAKEVVQGFGGDFLGWGGSGWSVGIRRGGGRGGGVWQKRPHGPGGFGEYLVEVWLWWWWCGWIRICCVWRVGILREGPLTFAAGAYVCWLGCHGLRYALRWARYSRRASDENSA